MNFKLFTELDCSCGERQIFEWGYEKIFLVILMHLSLECMEYNVIYKQNIQHLHTNMY